ncbi:hypothetical protein Desku_0733 [Desulfofundulus kuznetsovii DSM 6115]|uniref:Uncharacterized protein n=2 Tax=Desulfofundulus kuznetsovii TaxID=58135 RepID=A0AAU8P926_DESK7|nr:hypothetical protein Desku_0733 [Desulfofundulus kuznetsovii DSM 6115]
MESQKRCHNYDQDLINQIREMKLQGLSDSEIAKKLGVARNTVAKWRKICNIEPAPRGKSSTVDVDLLVQLHEKGYADGAIAEMMGISRTLVVKVRKTLGLRPNRRKGERGPGRLRENVPLYQEARRILNDPSTARIIYAATREYLKRVRNDENLTEEEKQRAEAVAWATTIIHPGNILHPSPPAFTSPAEKTNMTHIEYVLKLEHRNDFAGVCGAPSPVLLEAALQIRGAEEEAAALAEYVQYSGYVNTHKTVAEIMAETHLLNKRPEDIAYWHGVWDEQDMKAREWAPVKEGRRIRRCVYRMSEKRITNGKKGKGGGYQNTEARRAYLGAMGY